jgi:RNA polymerase sigma factor (sigma-70 family)
VDEAERVRAAIHRLGERERQLLLLRAEGYGYRELAAALGLNEASVGTLLARAKRAFRESYQGSADAP